MMVEYYKSEEIKNFLSSIKNGSDCSFFQTENNINVLYDHLSNTTDKIYIANDIKVTETYEGNVMEDILLGSNYLKPIEIRKGDDIFLFDKDNNGNDITIISNVREWENEGVESKTYLAHIESLDECEDSDLYEVEYREYGC